MNYLALKNMIDIITQSYKCPECSGKIDDSNIEIMGTAGNIINVDIFCPKCERHSIMKAEVSYAGKNVMNKEIFEKIKKELIKEKEKYSIKDKDVIDLNNKLNNENTQISDLF